MCMHSNLLTTSTVTENLGGGGGGGGGLEHSLFSPPILPLIYTFVETTLTVRLTAKSYFS